MKVELRMAYEWTCEDCGRNNFKSSLEMDSGEEGRLNDLKRLGMVEEFSETIPEELEGGKLFSVPSDVVCTHCGSAFETFYDY